MPYASDAQRRFFHSAGAKKAGITKAQVAEYDRASKGRKLPERLGVPKRAAKMVHHSPTMPEVDCHKQYAMTPVKRGR